MLLIVFVAITPLIVFFGVFAFIMNRFEKRLPPENRHVPLGHYIGGLVIAAIPALIAFVAAYIVAFYLEQQLGAMSVQAALDEQCGKGLYVADARGYDGDPYPSWSGNGVYCEILGSSQQDWVCRCPPVTDK